MAFSRIVRCPQEILRLVAPPVGDHRARIVAPRGPVARAPVRARPAVVRVTASPARPSPASPARALSGESIVPRQEDRRRGTRDRVIATPETRSRPANARHAALTAKRAVSVALDLASPVETNARRIETHRAAPRRQVGPVHRISHVTVGTERTPPRVRALPLAPRPRASVPREDRAQTVGTNRTTATVDRACRRATARRVVDVRNLGPGS